MFKKLKFAPGINKETTRYDNSGGWYDCDKIRFRNGMPEKFLGWTRLTSATFMGSCRLIHRFRNLSGTIYSGIGTHLRFYIEDGGALSDITPWVAQDTGLTDPFTTTAASAEVQVTKAAHDRAVGDRIVISGASGFDGLATGDLNGERTVSEVVDINNYKFTAGGTASAGATGGGSPVTIQYLIKDGIDQQVFGTGWGADGWGDGGWGEAGTGVVSGEGSIRTWSADAFGEDLVFNAYDDGVFYWDATTGTSARGFPLSALPGASNPPSVARIVMVSDVDRHIVAFGTDTVSNPGVQDPLQIRWSDQENAADWTPSTTNTAGGILLSSGSEIITAVRTRQQILVWTDDSLVSLQYIGGDYTFGAHTLAFNTSIIGRNAAVNHLGTAYWMGESGFYAYDGQVRELDCTVEDYIFDRMNKEQTAKVFAGTNGNEAEIVWFYPSGNSTDVDSYVIFNIKENVWYHGTMDRTCWIDRFLSSNPIAASQDGYLYNHDDGLVDGSTSPGSVIDAYIESSPIEIGDGYQYMFIDRFIPDVTFENSTAATPSVNVVLKVFNESGSGSHDSNEGSVAKTASSPIEQFTRNIWVRLRGRSLVVRYEDDANTSNSATTWRIGSPRINMRTDGRK